MPIVRIDEAFDNGCAAVMTHSLLFQVMGVEAPTDELMVEMEVLDTVYVTCAVELVK
jgi:hypothetical protein